jgi:Ni2+-binding GTPase involved in maturation of urease and hydrogenase
MRQRALIHVAGPAGAGTTALVEALLRGVGERFVNAAVMLDARVEPARIYDAIFVQDGAGADACLACSEWEPKCPQAIPVIEKLKEANTYLTATDSSDP